MPTGHDGRLLPELRPDGTVLAAGLQSALPPSAVIETRRSPMGDLWRSIEGFKRGSPEGVLLGVTGGRIAEGVDFPDEELEAVVVVGIPYPRPTAKREALRRFLDATTGRGWEYVVEAPAQRAMLQAFGRMIRSENDRGIGIVLDRRPHVRARARPARSRGGPRARGPCVLRAPPEDPAVARAGPRGVRRATAGGPMIITRTPLRISFAGGGTDLPSFYRKYGGGAVVSAAIDRYIHVLVNDEVRPLDPGRLLPDGERRPPRRPAARPRPGGDAGDRGHRGDRGPHDRGHPLGGDRARLLLHASPSGS